MPNYSLSGALNRLLDWGVRTRGYNGSTSEEVRVASTFEFAEGTLLAGTALPVWTPGAGLRTRLMGGVLSASAATILTVRSVTTDTIVFRANFSAAGTVPFNFGQGVLVGGADEGIEVVSSASTDVQVLLYGTEE